MLVDTADTFAIAGLRAHVHVLLLILASAIDAFGLRPNDLVPYVPGRQARWFPKTS